MLSVSHIFFPVAVETAGTSPPKIWSKKLVDTSLHSRRTQEQRCSCSSTYLLLFKGEMRSPCWLHSTPC